MSNIEHAIVVVGGENGRPWGSKAEGFSQAPHLDHQHRGMDLADIVIGSGSGTETMAVSTALVANELAGSELRLGTAAVPLAGVAAIVSNTTGTITVAWSTAAAAGTVDGYVVREGYALTPQVRVLVPFQPEGPDPASSAVPFPATALLAGSIPPGFTLPSAITTFEDWGLFLEHTFLEGIAGFGISELTDSRTSPAIHTVTAVTGTTMDFANAIPADLLVGGYLRVVDGATAGEPVSWARITGQTATQLVFSGGWEKGITPIGAVGSIRYEAWVPHYDNSPHAYTPGWGFRYPGNDMQPSAFGNGQIRNTARGITTGSYGDRFGPVLELGHRLSEKLGVRVNIVHLSVNEASLLARGVPNVEGFLGTLGWWDNEVHSDWSEAKTGGLYDRLSKMLTTIAPNALTAEGNTKDLRYLGIVLAFGEEDTQTVAGQEEYTGNAAKLVAAIRNVIGDAGLSPYLTPSRIPVVHPLITETPWEALYDTGGMINDAIREVTATDGFGATIDPESSPKITGDAEHFNGVGEALNGNLLASALSGLIDYALSFGSAIVEDTDQQDAAKAICNLALSHIGEFTITSLDTSVDTSRQAALCALYYPKARDMLLAERTQWTFAMRRVALVRVPDVLVPESWEFGYWVPPEAQTPFTVLPPDAPGDYSVANSPIGVPRWETELPSPVVGQYVPEDYSIESDAAGHRILFTHVEDAVLRYVHKTVDARRFSDLFTMALSYRLASFLAGPIIKGREGASVSAEMLRLGEHYLGKAATRDGRHRQIKPVHRPPWLAAR